MLKHSPVKLLISLLLLIIGFQVSAAKLAIVIDDFGYRVKKIIKYSRYLRQSALRFYLTHLMVLRLRQPPINKGEIF